MTLSRGCIHALMVAASVVLLAATRPASLEPEMAEPTGPEMVEATGGHCSEADLAKMNKAGNGTSPSSFPGMCTECGKTSWSLLGFDTRKYSRCLARKARISLPCAGCYAGSGKYGFDHCKVQCLLAWCDDSCLNCIDHYRPQLDACVGSRPNIVCRT